MLLLVDVRFCWSHVPSSGALPDITKINDLVDNRILLCLAYMPLRVAITLQLLRFLCPHTHISLDFFD